MTATARPQLLQLAADIAADREALGKQATVEVIAQTLLAAHPRIGSGLDRFDAVLHHAARS